MFCKEATKEGNCSELRLHENGYEQLPIELIKYCIHPFF